MKKLLAMLLLSAMLTLNAQEVKSVKSPRNVYQTEQQAIGKGTKTTLWIVKDGVKHEIYTGSKGGQYYIVAKGNTCVRVYGTFK